jgi:hypothetical protein
MSSTWRYTPENSDGQISEIWCDGFLNTPVRAGIRIFPWRVRLNTGEVRGLYSLTLSDFSGADRKALENALKNAKELQNKWSGDNPRRVEEVQNESCWSCC